MTSRIEQMAKLKNSDRARLKRSMKRHFDGPPKEYWRDIFDEAQWMNFYAGSREEFEYVVRTAYKWGKERRYG